MNPTWAKHSFERGDILFVTHTNSGTIGTETIVFPLIKTAKDPQMRGVIAKIAF